MGKLRVVATGVAAFIALTLAAGSMPTSLGAAPGPDTPGPATGDGVVPVLVPDNPDCASFELDGVKVNTEENGDGSEGAPNGSWAVGTGTVTISNSDGILFDWASVGQLIDLVIVKAGDGADTYVYDPADNADTRLHAPAKDDGTLREISHVSFCFGDDGQTEEHHQFIDVTKFYDANANGVNDDEQLLTGWKVNISPTYGDFFTPVHQEVAVGDYSVSEYAPLETNWVRTTASPVEVSVAQDETESVTFGNVCLGTGGNTPRTKGFWTNKNGQALFGSDDLAAMQALNLRNANGSDFNPTSYNNFKSWLGSANATNMAYMLSAQLAAMKLNTLNGLVSTSSLVYAPGLLPFAPITGLNALGFISVADLITAANNELGAHGSTLDGSPFRAYQGALKDVIDAGNQDASTVFVQPTPCQYTFEVVLEAAPIQAKKHKAHKGHRRNRNRRR